MIHGGDIYRNRVKLDFSVNVNPLGMPASVKQALQEAVESCTEYPDIRQEALKAAVSDMFGIRREELLCGNGASELFMAVVHALHPRKVVIPVPSFYGYEYAAKACGSSITYYPLKEEKAFGLDEGILKMLDADVDMLFLANPNNPAGGLLTEEFLCRLLEHCHKQGIYVVMDECFLDFCRQATSCLPYREKYENLICIRAFTKIFAIPGVRLGFLINSDKELTGRIAAQLPEWNLSAFAQKAGIVCASGKEYIRQTGDYVETEGRFLSEGLREAGLKVYPHVADFILVYTKMPLYERLLEKGILIRDCGNFRGLSNGYYRIAIKRREDNEQLLKEVLESV